MSLGAFSSNNPFRRAVSPVSSTPPVTSPLLSPPFEAQANRMSSNNPFLDNYQPQPARQDASPPKAFMYDPSNRREAAVNARNAAELMVRRILWPCQRIQSPLQAPTCLSSSASTNRYQLVLSKDNVSLDAAMIYAAVAYKRK